jgi:hypothetical protein
MLSGMVMGNQKKIKISDKIWKTNPNVNPMFGHSKLIRTHDGMGIKRIWVKGLINREKR